MSWPSLLPLTGRYGDKIQNGEVVDAIISVFVDPLGAPLAALIFFGATGAAFYIVQEKAIIPVLMIIMIGGTALAAIPSAASRVVIMLLLVALAAMIYLAYQRALGSSRFR